jgi:hypothetical protein
MKKKNIKDEGFEELLEFLRKHPEVVREIVFHSENLERLLSGKARGGIGEFLSYLGGPDDGYPIALCGGATKYLCAKGTKLQLCGGGTKPY